MSTKIEYKKVENLENYDVTKATEGDYIPVVGTGDGNKLGKIPVSEVRDIMAKFSAWNIVTMIISFITSLIKGRTGEAYDGATAVNSIFAYVKENWFDWTTGELNSETLNALKTFVAQGILQLTDDVFAIIKIMPGINLVCKEADNYYWGRDTKKLYTFTSNPLPDSVYVAHKMEDGEPYDKPFGTLIDAQNFCEGDPNATIEVADWAGGADKQPYVFDWTKQRVSDLLTAMDMEEFMAGLLELNPFRSINKSVRGLSRELSNLTRENLISRVLLLENQVEQLMTLASQAMGGNANNGGGQGENILTQAMALNLELNSSDSAGMTLDEILSALETKLGITPDQNATVEERWAAIQTALNA